MLYMNYPRCGDCAFSASFVRECTYVSYIAREGVELTVHKEGVVVEEIKEVELRSRRAQFIYDRNYNRIELRRRGHAPSRLSVKKLRRLLHKRGKVRVFYGTVSGKYHFLIIPLNTKLIPQPRRRSVRSHSVLLHIIQLLEIVTAADSKAEKKKNVLFVR